jgi:hypothetical protein
MPDSVWNTITSRPRLLPLPTPVHHSPDSKKEATLAYKSYDELKDIPTSPIHRPSYKPCSDPSAAAKKIDQDLKDKIPEEIKKEHRSGKTKPNLWHSNNVRAVVLCQNCGKWRCIYAWPMATEDHVARVDMLNGVLEEPDFEYICGDALFGLEDNPYPLSKGRSHVACRLKRTTTVPVKSSRQFAQFVAIPRTT